MAAVSGQIGDEVKPGTTCHLVRALLLLPLASLLLALLALLLAAARHAGRRSGAAAAAATRRRLHHLLLGLLQTTHTPLVIGQASSLHRSLALREA